MFLFSHKKTLLAQGIFDGFTDSHSHILYGVDDGVETLEESLRILKEYEALNINKVWLTPHIQEYMPNTTERLNVRFKDLQAAYNGPLQLHLSAEYMLDNLFLQRLQQNDLLLHSLPGEQPKLLVETSYFNPPMNLWGILHDIKDRGIQPIIAHPERYLYMQPSDYDRLHSEGYSLQLNLPSLLGHYGHEVQRRAETLLDQHYITHLGTDIHSEGLLQSLKTRRSKLLHP